MKEFLDYYDIQGEKVGSMEKKSMHERMRKEYAKKGKVTIRHRHVHLILMTSQGRVILQRRSKWKGDNAGLWDKSIGGHVQSGDSYDLTMLKECAEELGIPATIVKKEFFAHSVSVTDLNVLGILTPIHSLDNYQSTRVDRNGEKWVEPSMTKVYIGYYDGHIKFMDKESSGIQVFSPGELANELKNNPRMFTDDMRFIIKRFNDLMKAAPKKRDHVLND